MSLYKHMHDLAAARDDETRPLSERITAAGVLKMTCWIAYERAQAKAKELTEQQSVNTVNVLMERFADTLRCYPEPKND
jgi:hypothetical protein